MREEGRRKISGIDEVEQRSNEENRYKEYDDEKIGDEKLESSSKEHRRENKKMMKAAKA